MLQLTCLVDRVNSNLMKGLTIGIFLNVVKAIDTIWVKSLLFKLIILNFPSYLVETLSSYLQVRHICHNKQAGAAQGIHASPVMFSLYVNDILQTTFHQLPGDLVYLSTSYMIGGLALASQRGPLCCLLGL